MAENALGYAAYLVGDMKRDPTVLGGQKYSKLACDFEVVSLMHQRGLGNSSSQIQRKLQECHAEVWL